MDPTRVRTVVNPFTYALNSPTISVDPSGEVSFLTDYYSRGNDDISEKNYETALVTTNLILDDERCRWEKVNFDEFGTGPRVSVCLGSMDVYLRFAAWNTIGYKGNESEAELPAVQFESQIHWLVVDDGSGKDKGRHVKLEPLQGQNIQASHIGLAIAGTLKVGTVSCCGGTLHGSGWVENPIFQIQPVPGIERKKFKLWYSLRIVECGAVHLPTTQVVLRAVAQPNPRMGPATHRGADEVLRLVKSNYRPAQQFPMRFPPKFDAYFDEPRPFPDIPQEKE